MNSDNITFYQWILSKEHWLQSYCRAGFKILGTYYLAGYAGLYHEIPIVKMLDDRGFIPTGLCRFIDDSFLSRWSGHSFLSVLGKN